MDDVSLPSNFVSIVMIILGAFVAVRSIVAAGKVEEGNLYRKMTAMAVGTVIFGIGIGTYR